MKIYRTLKKNIDYIKSKNSNKDLIVRNIFCGTKQIAVVFLDDQTDSERLELYVISKIVDSKQPPKSIFDLQNQIISVSATQVLQNLDDCLSEIMGGNSVVFMQGSPNAIKCATLKYAQRSVTEPPNSDVIFGPREGFVENLKTNMNLVRKRLPTTELKTEELHIGRYTKTKVEVCYIDNIADHKVVEKIKSRLQQIDIDGIIDAHYLTSFLEERKNSIFKQIGKCEKPDIVVAKLLEGRVAIMVDNSPVVLTLPFIFLEDLQNSDDYYQRSFRISFIRFLRLFGILISMLVPGIYVAIQLYHYRIIPIKFLVTIMDSTQGITFSPFMETLFVLLLFDILFEASLRMPKYIGVAVSIVGALVLGDTAVRAGLVSSPTVMIVALTGISFYTVPDQVSQLAILRLAFTLLGGMIGFLGIIVGWVLLVTYLVEFNAYDAPYFAPYAPFIKEDLKDGLFKRETIALKTRPKSVPNKNRTRKK